MENFLHLFRKYYWNCIKKIKKSNESAKYFFDEDRFEVHTDLIHDNENYLIWIREIQTLLEELKEKKL